VKRRVSVPGDPLEVSTILTDDTNNVVLSIPVNNRVVVIFTSTLGNPTARIMTYEEAAGFTAEILGAYQALNDDVKIQQMERDFGSGLGDD
jgi:hypothetical protein